MLLATLQVDHKLDPLLDGTEVGQGATQANGA